MFYFLAVNNDFAAFVLSCKSRHEELQKYDVKNLKDGYNIVNGEKIFYISNPALGLRALKEKF